MSKKNVLRRAILVIMLLVISTVSFQTAYAGEIIHDTISIAAEDVNAEFAYGDPITLDFKLQTLNINYLEYYYVYIYNSSNKELYYYRGTFDRSQGCPYTTTYTYSVKDTLPIGKYSVKIKTTYNTATVSYFEVVEKTCKHKIVIDPAVAATCTTAGKTEGSHCSLCGEVIKAQTTIAAKGHKVVTDPAVAATCTTAGKTEGSHCSVCKTVIKAQTTIAAKGHKVVTDPAVAATCTTAGKTEGSHCSVCKTVIKAQTTIAAKGHKVVTDPGYEATYTTTGMTDGTHCSVCSTVLTKQTVIDKLPLPFKDVSNYSWYANAVRLMLDRGIMSGTSATTFGPSEKLTRAQLVVMLWNFEGRPAVEYTNAFSDVSNGKYYTNAVEWARTTGIVNGSNGRFYPGNEITRQDFAVILKNYAAYKQLDTQIADPNAYMACKDYKSVSNYAKLSIQWAYERNLIGANGSLAPKDHITRGEAAAMLQRFLIFFEL